MNKEQKKMRKVIKRRTIVDGRIRHEAELRRRDKKSYSERMTSTKHNKAKRAKK